MEAPPHSAAPPISTTTTATPALYAGSVGSSPRTRHTGSYNADPPPPPPKLRLMCSYGGHVVPRPHDKTLCYVGGDTRIIAVDRHTSLSEFNRRLSKILLDNQPFSLKYQLPDEDLDSLISVTADEDFENMVDEYDRLSDGGGRTKHGRLRLFLFPKSPSSVKSEGWFFNALNWKAGSGSDRGFSESSSVNCLLGLDDDFFVKAAAAAAVAEKDAEPLTEGSKSVGTGNGVFNGGYVGNQDVHSVRGSPLPETSSSSSGSGSGSPSDPKTGGSGIEEQFQQMSVGVAGNVNSPLQPKQEDARVFTAGGGVAAGSGTVVSGLTAVVGGEYAAANRGSSDDERSDHGGYIQVQQIQPQVQPPQLQTQQTPQFQQNQISASDLPSPDSVSSEEITKNLQSKQIQATYQEPLIQSTNAPITPNHVLDPKTTDQNNLHMHPQFQESSYVLSAQYDQTHITPQQFIHANNQYIPAVPIASYYPIYPSQEQHQPMLDNQYPMYYISNRQPPQSRNAPEIGVGLYRATTTAAGVQYVGYSQIHHPSSAAVNPGYGYEYAEPNTNHGQMYYTPLPHHQLAAAAKYQTAVAAGPTVAVLPDASAPQARTNEQF